MLYPLSQLNRLARWVALGLFVLLLVFLGALFGARATLNEQLRVAIEAGALDAAGLNLEVGQIQGNWWNGLTLKDVVVHGGPDRQSPVLARVPVARADYSLLSFFGARPQPIRLDFYHPAVSLVMGRDHLLSLQPRLRAPHDEPPPAPAPSVDLHFHSAHVRYEDQGAFKPFVAELENVNGGGTLRGFDLALDLQGLRDGDLIRAEVGYDLAHQRGRVRARAQGASLPYWLDRFAYSPDWRLVAGRADVDVTVSWQDPMLLEELKLTGQARLRDGELRVRNVAAPLLGLHGPVALSAADGDVQARLEGVEGRWAEMPLRLNGTVGALVRPVPALGLPDPTLALEAIAPTVQLERLERLFPGLRGSGLAGEGTIRARIAGTTLFPDVALDATVPSARYGAEALRDGTIQAVYRTGLFDVTRFRFALAGGSAEGRLTYHLPARAGAPVPYVLAGRFTGLGLEGLLARHLDEPLPFPVTGKVDGRFRTEGLGAHAKSRYDLAWSGGTLAGRPVAPVQTRYEVEDGRWKLPATTVAWGRSRAEIEAAGTPDARFQLRYRLPEAALADLVACLKTPPPMRLSGQVTGEGRLDGRLGAPESWRGPVTARLRGVRADAAAIPALAVEGRLADNTFAIDRLAGAFGRGRVSGTGSFGPLFAPAGVTPRLALDARAAGVELAGAWPWPAELHGLAGRLDGEAKVALQGAHYELDGHARVAALRQAGWGRLEAVEARFRCSPRELELFPLVWHQRGERVEAEGRVRLGAHPQLNLGLRARGVQLSKLLAAVDWPAVTARLQPQPEAAIAREAKGPVRPAIALPGEPAPADLRGQLERWLALRKPPLNRPGTPPLVPFWEGTKARVDAEARLVGDMRRPSVGLRLEAADVAVLDRHLEALSFAGRWSPTRLVVEHLRAVEGGRTVLTAGGAFGDRPSDELLVQTHGLDLGWSERFLRPSHTRLEGTANVTLRARGPWRDPRIGAEGSLAAGSYTGEDGHAIPFEGIEARIGYEGGALAISRAVLRQDGHEASVTGQWPLGGGTSGGNRPIAIALRLEDENLAIANLFSQGRFQWLGGKGFAELHVGGTVFRPSLDGRVRLREGRLLVKGLDTPIEGFAADVDLDDTRIALNSVVGHYGGGELDATGDVYWDHFEPERYNVSVLARPFRLSAPGVPYKGMAEAQVSLSGPVAAPTLAGRVALWDGVVELNEATKETPKAAGAGLPPWRLGGLQLVLGPTFRLKHPLVDLVATTTQRQGGLKLHGSLAAPKPQGTVVFESGVIRPLNNAFTLQEGKVEFLGEQLNTDEDLLGVLDDAQPSVDDLNARLDLQASAPIYDYGHDETVNVTAKVKGTLRQMEMRFSAEPIRSEQEILDMLSKKQVLAGTFGGRLDGGQVIVKEVGGLVTSNLDEFISPYTLFLRNALQLQTLRFELVADSQKSGGGLTNWAGFKPALWVESRPLWDRLAFTSRLVPGEVYATTPVGRGNTTTVGLNFRLNRNLAVEYRIDPYIDADRQRTLNHNLGFKAQFGF